MGKTIVVLLGVLGWGAMAGADPITLFNDRREITVLARVSEAGVSDRHTDSRGPGDVLRTETSASTGISVASATASLISSLGDPAHLLGTGSALAGFFTSGEGEASATAFFQVDFSLDTPYMYAFNGMFNISDFPPRPSAGFTGFNEARWSAALSSGSSSWFNASDTNRGHVSFGGTLPAGSYHFLVGTSADGLSEREATVVEDSSFDFALDLTPADSSPSPTPEPASLLLISTGIAGLVARRSRG
jgi:PEP-CTERM motif